uniref:Uncharacterized protein n=1 Tax=Anguilla anguilla TaxID=7936 RepID=A0A0E9PNS7_ANGAN
MDQQGDKRQPVPISYF